MAALYWETCLKRIQTSSRKQSEVRLVILHGEGGGGDGGREGEEEGAGGCGGSLALC